MCPIHSFIHSQTFSLDQMEFLVCHAEFYQLCQDCKYTFRKRIAAAVQKEIAEYENKLERRGPEVVRARNR